MQTKKTVQKSGKRFKKQASLTQPQQDDSDIFIQAYNTSISRKSDYRPNLNQHQGPQSDSSGEGYGKKITINTNPMNNIGLSLPNTQPNIGLSLPTPYISNNKETNPFVQESIASDNIVTTGWQSGLMEHNQLQNAPIEVEHQHINMSGVHSRKVHNIGQPPKSATFDSEDASSASDDYYVSMDDTGDVDSEADNIKENMNYYYGYTGRFTCWKCLDSKPTIHCCCCRCRCNPWYYIFSLLSFILVGLLGFMFIRIMVYAITGSDIYSLGKMELRELFCLGDFIIGLLIATIYLITHAITKYLFKKWLIDVMLMVTVSPPLRKTITHTSSIQESTISSSSSSSSDSSTSTEYTLDGTSNTTNGL